MEINLNANDVLYDNIVSCKSLNTNKNMLLGIDNNCIVMNA